MPWTMDRGLWTKKNCTMQTTSNILMIRPVHFTYNPETAVNNKFQVAGNAEAAQAKALADEEAVLRARSAARVAAWEAKQEAEDMRLRWKYRKLRAGLA